MLLAGPVREDGDTDRSSSGSASDGGKITMGRELRRAAHLLITMMKVTIDRGEFPVSWAALKAVLKEPMAISILAWWILALLKGILTSKPSFLRPEISSLAFWLSTVAS